MGIFKGKHAKLLTLMVSISLIVVLGYIAITDDKESKAKSEEVIKNCTEYEDIVGRDLDKDYPVTAREVIKFYCKAQQCMFNNTLEDNSLETIVDKEFQLYDKEFAKLNPFQDLLEKRKEEIEQFKKDKETIFGYQVDTDEKSSVWKNNGHECCAVEVVMTLSGEKKKTIKEVFILRKNETEQWKITGSMSEKDYRKNKKVYNSKKK